MKKSNILSLPFLLACSLFTQRFSIMKTADQRNRVFTGLKIQISAMLVPYPSSETPLNLCNITTFQWFPYILTTNFIMPSPNRQRMRPLTAMPTTKNPYILYPFFPLPKLPVPTSYPPSKPSHPLIIWPFLILTKKGLNQLLNAITCNESCASPFHFWFELTEDSFDIYLLFFDMC